MNIEHIEYDFEEEEEEIKTNLYITDEEIDESEEIYTGLVKHLTGNDSFVARDLFQKKQNCWG